MRDTEDSEYRSGDARVVVENPEGAEVILDWMKTTQ